MRQEMRGQAQDAIRRAVETAQRDVIFLFRLCFNSNIDVLAESKANLMELMLLYKTLEPWDGHEAPMLGCQPWADAASAFLREVHAQTSAAEYLGKRYFQGRSPLFPQTEENLHTLVESAEHLVALYNDWLLDPCPARSRTVQPGRLGSRSTKPM